jgi:uncharacterized protein YkwD/uncharacterized membrane protein required for colicin V production
MNSIDALVLLVLVFYGVAGYFRGFLQSLAGLVGLILTLSAAWFLYLPLSGALKGVLSPQAAPPAAFIGLLLLLHLLYSVLLRWAFRRMPPEVRKSSANRALGVLPGLLDGVVMTALLLTILVTLPSDRIPREEITASTLGKPLLDLGTAVQVKALDRFGDSVRALVPLRIVEPGTQERVHLPFHTNQGLPDPVMERQMWDMVNRERVQRGLSRLQWDDRLKVVAREHSQDMLNRGYFSHYSPEGTAAMERVTAHGWHFPLIGENLALAPSLKIAHEGLMQSPGHRANILHPEFDRVGVGIIVARPYGLMVTQVFAKK